MNDTLREVTRINQNGCACNIDTPKGYSVKPIFDGSGAVVAVSIFTPQEEVRVHFFESK